jgi:pimeloyl-ACP methyl ester carboxylesterase
VKVVSIAGLKQTYINVKGVQLYCEYELNNKPKILFIHGFASSLYTFRKIVPLLKGKFSLLAVDLPGFGRSEKSSSFIYSLENYARVMIECLNYFRIEKAHIAAHSMGGQIALHMAGSAPEKVGKLALLCSSGYLKRAKTPLIYTSYLPFFHKFVYRYVHRKDVSEHLSNVFFDKSLIDEQLIEEFSRPLAEKEFYKSLIRLLRHREGDLHPDQLRGIVSPILLIWGENDRVVPVQVGRQLVKDLPNAKLITYQKTGHLITEERPEQIYRHIMEHMT